jgi:mono/diheme cytochrome c family protein
MSVPFIVAVVLLATASHPTPAPAQPLAEALFQTRCAACHSLTRAMRPLRAIAAAERRARLDAFLRGHHTDPAEREVLADYLVNAASR